MWGQERKTTEQVNEGEDNAEVATEKPVQGTEDISAFVG